MPNVTKAQSPIMKRNPESPSGKMPGSTCSGNTLLEKPSMSPSLYRHHMNKEKIDAMVKSAYKEESDSVKVGRYRALKSNLSFIVYQIYRW